jgi:shikimate kinase
VFSLGGRTPLNQNLASPLKAMGLNVYIRIDPEEAWRRVSRSGIPAFLTSENPEKEFLDLYRKREPFYENQADLIVGLSRAPLSQNADILQSEIEEWMHAR